MKSAAILVSLIGVLQSASCEGGGPSAYGYDASSVCNRPYNSRASRAYLENLPCDFRHQNWCTVAGSAYPWHAVRRFVQENQGLMRRMYGVDRHIDILKAEFEKNDVELEYDDRYERYLYETRRHRDNFGPPGYTYEDDDFSGKHYTNHGSSTKSGKLSKRYRDPTRSHFRKSRAHEILATDRTTTPNTNTTKSSPTTTMPSTEKGTNLREENMVTSTTDSTITEILEATTPMERKVTVDLETERPTTTLKNAENGENFQEEFNSTTTVPSVDRTDSVHNLSINEISGQIDRMDVDIEELTEIPEEEISQDKDDDSSSSSTRGPDVQQFRPRPEYKPSEDKQSTAKPDNSDTQHYHQDIDSKNQHREGVLKLRGINACPVKDEVVAPLWANNTRGEILALINHYPFEQYVHWEKCTHENKQMYCRDGCRCEQQFRLHRLLAFDPNNECRGIFSDWFKFPSCCVCRCYDLPLEFRVTSRSPRNLKRKIKIRTPRY